MGVVRLSLKGKDGSPIEVYVENRLEGGDVSTGRKEAGRTGAGRIEEATASLESQLEVVASIAQSAMDKLKAISPDKTEIEMGVTFSATAGVPLITQGSASANMKVTISWGK